MKVKNGDIYLAREPLQQLAEIKWPVKVSYSLAKLSNKLDSEFRVIENVRNGLIKKHGTEAGIKPGDENWDKFLEEYQELMENESEVVIEPVELPSEIDGKAVEVEPAILKPLMSFITVE